MACGGSGTNRVMIDAIILAAGRGSRLAPLTDECPKCLLELRPGHTLLDAQLEILLANPAVGRVVIVVGYKKALIMAYVEERYPNAPVTFAHADAWDSKNNADSLARGIAHVYAEGALRGLLQINGDVVAEPAVIEGAISQAASCPDDEAFFCVKEEPCGDEEMKAVLDTAGRVLMLTKKVASKEAFGEAFGINYFGPRFARSLELILERLAVDAPQLYFEDGINLLLTEKIAHTYLIGNRSAFEVDFPEDLARARSVFSL